MTKQRILQRTKLYVLLDKGLIGQRDIEGVTLELVKGGAQMVQYRDKISEDKEYLENARAIQKILGKYRIPLIINDRLEVAWYLNSDGVHLGQGDIPIRMAKKLLRKETIIGGSGETVEQAVKAQREGADYIGVGPIFPTTTKDIKVVRGIELLKKVLKRVSIPCFAIGGINFGNLDFILRSGCNRVVVGSAILKSKDLSKACREFLNRLT